MSDTKVNAVGGFKTQAQLKATIAKLYKMGAKSRSGLSAEEFFKKILETDKKNLKDVGLSLQTTVTYFNISEDDGENFNMIPVSKLTLKTPLYKGDKRAEDKKKAMEEMEAEIFPKLEEVVNDIIKMRRKRSWKKNIIKFINVFFASFVIYTIWIAIGSVAYGVQGSILETLIISFFISLLVCYATKESSEIESLLRSISELIKK